MDDFTKISMEALIDSYYSGLIDIDSLGEELRNLGIPGSRVASIVSALYDNE